MNEPTPRRFFEFAIFALHLEGKETRALPKPSLNVSRGCDTVVAEPLSSHMVKDAHRWNPRLLALFFKSGLVMGQVP